MVEVVVDGTDVVVEENLVVLGERGGAEEVAVTTESAAGSVGRADSRTPQPATSTVAIIHATLIRISTPVARADPLVDNSLKYAPRRSEG